MNSVIGHAAALLTCTLLTLWLTRLYSRAAELLPFGTYLLHFLRLGTIGIATLLLLRCVVLIVIRSARSMVTKRCVLCACALILIVMLLEAVFMFVPQSHGVGYTAGSRIWFQYYWNPINKLGYRDKEHDAGDVDRRKKVVVIGDSFAAGHGIKSVRDRFSDVLARHLSSEYTVLNLGRNGSDTVDEYRRLVDHSIAPDILILQYFGNDIEGAASQSTLPWPEFSPYAGLNRATRFIVDCSFLANFIYWQFPHADVQPYVDFLKTAYTTPDILERHLTDLAKFTNFARQGNIPLIVVIFPFMSDTAGSTFFTTSIREFFEESDVPVIDVSTLLVDIPLAERIVNSNDRHASRQVHKLVADELHALLMREGIVAE